MLAYSFVGLAQGAALIDMLDHSLVPFRSRARYLRLVTTKRHALNYAAGGFHVSVTRGLCGGTADLAAGFADGGTRAGACMSPLNRDDLRSKWREAAQAYSQAFHAATDGHPIDRVKVLLATANKLADLAYAGENVDPPRDPASGATEPSSPRRFSGVAVAGALVGFMGIVTYGIYRGKTARDAGMWV